MKSKVILIKKYENRRLYDTVNSRYVNLDDVARMLQKGDNIRVVDVISGEDITRLILTQIIVEDAKVPDSTFPVEILRQMVVASGRATEEGAVRYMQAMLDVYEKSYRVMAPPFPFRPQPGASARKPEPQPQPEAAAAHGDAAGDLAGDNIEELKRRVAELEGLVSKLAPRKPRKPATSAAPRKRKR